MSELAPQAPWRFYRFGLIVTGEGERQFLPRFFRSLMESGNCTFEVIRRTSQRKPVRSPKRKLQMVGTGKTIPDRDATEIGIPARHFLSKHSNSFLIVIDDLEKDRESQHRAIFDRYRLALDTMLTKELQPRASVHFFVYMLEAYYFADVDATNAVLGTELGPESGDVEGIPHPKNQLKQLVKGFDEIRDGEAIACRIDLKKVLVDPLKCRSLRSLIKWCVRAKDESYSEEFRLADGECHGITAAQIEALDELAQ